MVSVIDIINVGLFAAAIRMATPVAYASLGGIFSERAGVVNVGLEGMMLMGAFSGVLTSYYTGNPWLGVGVAILVGGALGLLHAVLTVKFAGNQIVSGTGINLFAVGFTAYMSQTIWGSRGASQSVQGLGEISFSPLKGIPLIGDALNTMLSYKPLVYVMFVVVILSYIVLFKTPLGLRIRAVGEHPAAADTAGINVYRTKYICLVLCGMLAGLGGVFLSLSNLSLFVLGMTGGRGFIALAAMILGGWKPIGALAASLLFGFTDALQMRLQSLGLLPAQIILAIPYILTVIVLAGFVRKRVPPSDYKPYLKE
jgi:simple sugar transport system permease protein